MADEYRVSRLGAEVLYKAPHKARVSRLALEVLFEAPTSTDARVSRLAVEVLYEVAAPAAGRRRGFMNFTP